MRVCLFVFLSLLYGQFLFVFLCFCVYTLVCFFLIIGKVILTKIGLDENMIFNMYLHPIINCIFCEQSLINKQIVQCTHVKVDTIINPYILLSVSFCERIIGHYIDRLGHFELQFNCWAYCN